MVVPFPHKIISGGQTGADRAGLDFAIAEGLEHGGYCPQGRRSEDGVIPAQYNLIETTDWKYRSRTILNVRESDATVIFNASAALSPGSGLTAQSTKSEARPCLILKGFAPSEEGSVIDDQASQFVAFLARFRPSVLNIAGNREASVSGISAHVYAVLKRARQVAKEGKANQPSNEASLPEVKPSQKSQGLLF